VFQCVDKHGVTALVGCQTKVVWVATDTYMWAAG